MLGFGLSMGEVAVRGAIGPVSLPGIPAPATFTVGSQTFNRLLQDDGAGGSVFRDYTLRQVTKFGETDWWFMRAKAGDKRLGDGNYRRIGWDAQGTTFAAGYEHTMIWDQVYSQECLNVVGFMSPMEVHVGMKAGDLGENSGTPKLMMENGTRTRVVSQQAQLNGSSQWTGGVDYTWHWQDNVDYHRLVALRRYRWEYAFYFHPTAGTLKVWLTEFAADGVTVLTARAQIVDFTGAVGFGDGRLGRPQFRIYCSEEGQPDVDMWTQIRSITSVSKAPPFTPIIDTYDGTGTAPADYTRTQASAGNTVTGSLAGGTWTISTGATPGGPNRFGKVLTGLIVGKRYRVELDYTSGAANVAVVLAMGKTAAGSGTSNWITHASNSAGTTGPGLNLNVASATTAWFEVVIPSDATAPSMVFEAGTTGGRSCQIREMRITEVVA